VPFETHIQPTNRPNLFVLTSGHVSLSPAEVFEGDAIDQLITKLREKFDFILFDAAPVVDFPDSLALASKVDSIILVTQSEKTSVEEARTMMGQQSGVDSVIFTPDLSASILPGITRDSVIRIARDLGMEVREQLIRAGIVP
jgi:Mrp family chromosome partitioning ATPase